MKAKTCIYLSILFLSLVLSSCKDDDNDEKKKGLPDDVYANEWIYKKMKEVYLWSDKLPKSPDYKMESSEKFFESLLYNHKDREGDRFSYIDADDSHSKKSVGSTDINLGFEYMPSNYFKTNIKGETSSVGLFILHVREGSDAEKKGLKRGQVIYAVDNEELTYSNYENILKNKNSFALSIYNENGKKTTLNKISASQGDSSPIWLDKVMTVNGTKIGYLVYNAFQRGTEEDTYKYDRELVNVLGEMSEKGITELVLDLRYNPGGYMTSAANLASAIVPNRSTKNVFAISEYNKSYRSKKEYDYFVDKAHGTSQAVPKLGVQRLYVLATEFTASASELVMNSLRPYMEVYHIGTTTVGKDKGSIAFPANDARIPWILHPLVIRLTNAKDEGNYIDGLDPNSFLDEWLESYVCVEARYEDGSTTEIPMLAEWKGGFVELGNLKEPMLAEAIAKITGTPRLKSSSSSAPIRTISTKIPDIRHAGRRYQMFVDEQKFEDIYKGQ